MYIYGNERDIDLLPAAVCSCYPISMKFHVVQMFAEERDIRK